MRDRWTCLLYHDLVATPAVGGPETYFAVSKAGFVGQLDMIQADGYRGCSIEEAIGLVGIRRVAISFDDGLVGQFVHGFPALVARGMSATFFVTTSWVGTPGYVSWEALRQMKAAGMSIQSHTHTHPFLSEHPARVLDELGESKRLLDRELDQNTATLALPGGDFPRASDAAAAAGYRIVATSRWGTNRDAVPRIEGLTYVRRCTVRGVATPEQFRNVLAGGFWLGVRRQARGVALAGLRRALGPSRYARWRLRWLTALDRALAGRV